MKPSSRKQRDLATGSQKKRQAIIVLGMHRSGTSALTRVLNLLGCPLDPDLVGAADGNESGHWESNAAVTLNDEILESAGSRWDDWGPINYQWRQSAIHADAIDRVVSVVQSHAALGPLFALKDPRICRLADLWLKAMDTADVDPRIILMLRNPAEVAESLENRDLMPSGYGYLLWLRHVLDAERLSRGRLRTLCRYDMLMRNWYDIVERIGADLGVVLPRNSPVVHSEIESFLNRGSRHHDLSHDKVMANPALSIWLRRTYAIMLAWSETGEQAADYPELDIIRSEFDRAYSTFARLVLPGERSGEYSAGSQLKRELDTRLTDAQQAAEAAQAALAQADAQRAAFAAREAELTAQIDAGRVQAQQLQSEIDSLRAEAEQLRNSATEDAQAAVLAADARAQQLHAEIVSLRTESELLRGQAATLAAEHATIESRLATFRAEAERELQQRLDGEARLAETAGQLFEQSVQRAELAGRVAAAESAMIQRQEELAQVWSQLLAAEKARVLAESTASQAAERRIELERRVASAESEAADLRRQLAEVRATPAPVPDHLHAEIAQLTRMLHDQESSAQRALAAQASAEAALAQRGEEIGTLKTEFERQQAATRTADAARAAAEQKLASRFDEIARLTTYLADEGRKARVAGDQVDWLLQMTKLAQSFPKWWALMPRDWRQQREHRRYRKAGLFDAARYLETYPDVASDGMDPVRHYILHGLAEGRQRPL